jgi:hypothetical protein
MMTTDQRRSRTTLPWQPEHLVRLRRGRIVANGAEERRALEWLCMHKVVCFKTHQQQHISLHISPLTILFYRAICAVFFTRNRLAHRWSRRTCCARWACRTTWRTRRSASA